MLSFIAGVIVGAAVIMVFMAFFSAIAEIDNEDSKQREQLLSTYHPYEEDDR